MPAKKKTSKKNSAKKQDHRSTSNKKQPILSTGMEVGIGIVIVLILLALIFIPYKSPDGTGSGEVVLDMYVMSQCPYGVQAEDAAIPAVERFGGDVDYNVYFIVRSSGDTFQSLHGQPEVDEDMRQVCIIDMYSDEYLDYLSCFNPGYQNPEVQYANCAAQTGIDADKIATCVDERGVELLKASEAETAKVGATASPTIYLNGESYSSGRTELDFARAICEKFDYNHEGCADVPKPVEVEVTVLTDDACPTCDPARIIQVSKQLFPGAVFKTLDIDSAEGKVLAEEHKLVYLPAYIFDSAIEDTNTWTTNTQIQASFVESGDGYRIRDEAIGATWFIDKAKQAEYYASIGIVKGDNKPQIDFFVMSYCPYGNQAEEAIAPVFDILGGKAEFKPHYVIYSNYGTGYPDYCLDEAEVVCSMHGIQELNQDIREACVAKYMGIQEWFDFALAMNTACNSQNADICWTAVAEGLGLDTEVISTCEATEGYDLMMADKTLGGKQSVSGSPTVFIDGASYSGARSANGFLAGLCAAFDDAPAECDSVVAEPTTTTASAGGSC
ncbi:MAG: hypothetical protein ABH828_03670 [archaeon]